MNRVHLSFVTLLVIAAGCSSRNSYFGGDAGDGGGTSVTGSGTDGGKKKDGSTTIEEEDGGPTTTKDAGKKDSSVVTPTDCSPGSVSSFSPTWKGPAPLHANKCTATQVDALMCVFDASADQTACDAAVKLVANKTCFDCMYTPSTAAALGPVVLTGSLGSINIAGCIAATSGNTTSTGCGAKVQAADQCGDEACEANCPVDDTDDGTQLDARNACVTEANTTVCSTYATAAECADTLLDTGGASAGCNVGADFLTRATAIAKLFCVP